jgi:predicted XRE-type DNA-binding protein
MTKDKFIKLCQLEFGSTVFERIKWLNDVVAELPIEEWRDVVGYEGYYMVSNIGNVKSIDRLITFVRNNKEQTSLKQGKPLNPVPDPKNGYPTVCLAKEHNNRATFVHVIVAKAFVPNPYNKPFVNHIDGVKANNRVENLEWVTAKENTEHAFRIGLIKSGEEANHAKITDVQVDEIRQLLKQNEYSQEQIGAMYGVHQGTISRIKLNKFRYAI